MEYSFEPFLDAFVSNWFDDDALLKRLLDHYVGAGRYDAAALEHWGSRVAGPLREQVEVSARIENRPRLEHYDGYGRRVDRIVLPDSTLASLADVAGRERLGAVHGEPFSFYAMTYLYGQNGEAGVLCSLGCTDGLVRVIEAVGSSEAQREAVQRIRSSTPERVWHAAQFVTEVQGGSDVPANVTRAIPDGERWRLRGRKWFCSNVNADYFLVTARPEGSREGNKGIGLFLVPAYLQDGDWQRNGYTVDRLKEKLGTRELATAEVSFDGAVAYAVGPLEQGLSNLLRYVLTTSRLYCVQNAASTLRQAERIASAYTEFRSAFGRRLADFSLVKEHLEAIRRARRRALACFFELLRLRENAAGAGEDDTRVVDYRVLLSLSKPVLTMAATRLTRDAMMLLGGNGIEEEFSSLPRLFRDGVIMETWEGPHDVLFTQAFRDLRRFQVDPGSFIARVAGPRGHALADELRLVLREPEAESSILRFPRLAPQIVDAFADRVLEISCGLP